MTSSAAENYTRVPYPHTPHRRTRPDRLELVGRMLGMRPAPHERARVLDIGCATGGNLLPMAQLFPEAHFIGIDAAEPQIATARELAAAAGLTNVELLALDLGEVGERFGEFDYIIAHGVYSWVDEALQARLLDVIGARLAPDGIGFISHNVKPGWHARAAVREMMLYHVEDVESPVERVAHARALIAFIAESARSAHKLYREQLAAQMLYVANVPDEVLYHDYLADVNTGSFFHELVDELPARGLQYLADADMASMFGTGFSPEVLRTIEKLGDDLIRREQYMDFLKNRAFRMTLVCRGHHEITRRFDASELGELRFSSRARPEEPANLGDDSSVAFRTDHASARVSSPMTKAVLGRLAAGFPRTFAFEELLTDPAAAPELAGDLLSLFTYDIVELSRGADLFAVPAPAAPRTTPLARAQAARGLTVASLRHESPALDDAERALIQLLDGRPDPGPPELIEGLARKAFILR